jgi:hypothetical protein
MTLSAGKGFQATDVGDLLVCPTLVKPEIAALLQVLTPNCLDFVTRFRQNWVDFVLKLTKTVLTLLQEMAKTGLTLLQYF